jgi:hydroxyacylglutathione hydrolase
MKIQYQANGITVFESALYRTTSTIISFDKSILIIDPNWLPIEIDFIADYVKENYPTHRQNLLFTHSDYDHIIGYGAFPEAQVIASLYFENNDKKDEILQQIIDFDHTYYISRDYPISYPTVDTKIVTDGDVLTIDGIDLVFYHALGHVRDGLLVVIPDKKCWIVGDYLSNIEIPFIDHDYDAYLITINKAAQIFEKNKDVNILIVGHGDVATDRLEIKDRISLDTQYLNALGNLKGTDFTKLIHQYSDNPDMVKAHEKNVGMVSKNIKKVL